jgi:hypothetical protein
VITKVKIDWIEKFLLKMGSHDPFGYLKHKLWPKERP